MQLVSSESSLSHPLTHKMYVDRKHLSKLNPLASLDSCPCMFKEQLYAYAINTKPSCAGSYIA